MSASGSGVRPPGPPAQPPHGTGPGVPGSAPSPPGRRPVHRDPDAVRRASRHVMHFGMLLLGTLLVSPIGLPGQVVSLVLAVAAVVVGVRALRAVWRAGVRGALVPVLGVGLAFAMVLVVSLATMLSLWPLQERLQECLGDALTISAREQCSADFQQELQDRLEQARATQG